MKIYRLSIFRVSTFRRLIDYEKLIDFQKFYRLSTFHACARALEGEKNPEFKRLGVLFSTRLDVRCHFVAVVQMSDVIFSHFRSVREPKTGIFRVRLTICHSQSHLRRVAGLLPRVSAWGNVFIHPDRRRA